jgi:hypothetical protein
MRPALRFSGANSHRVTVAPAATINNMAAETWVAVVRRTGTGMSLNIAGKTTAAFPTGFGPVFVCNSTAVGDIKFSRWRTSTEDQATSDANALPLNRWRIIAAAYDSAQAGAARTRLYYADFGAALSETPTYASTNTTADSTMDDSGTSLQIGNTGSLVQAFPGDIARFAIFNVQLTLGLLRTLGFDLAAWRMPSLVGLWEFGQNGTGQQVDLSGRRNYGLVTGATVAPGPVDHRIAARRIGMVPAAATFQPAWAGLASRVVAPAVAA